MLTEMAKHILSMEIIHSFEKFNFNFLKTDIIKKAHRKYQIIEDNLQEIEIIEITNDDEYEQLQNVIWTISKIVETIFKVIPIDIEKKVNYYIEKTITAHKKLIQIISDTDPDLMEIDYQELKYITNKIKQLTEKL